MLIVKMICLAIGTVLAVLFILLTMRGKKEDWRIEGVPEKEFSDKELWAAGFAMQQMPMFSMDSAVGKKMISASAILHPENGGRFVEYWARLYWARTLSMSLLVLALAFCAAVFMDGYMLFAVLVAEAQHGMHDGVFQCGIQANSADELRYDSERGVVYRCKKQAGHHL